MARLVVDAMNVIGSRPTGWWRDIDGALRDLVERLERYTEHSGDEVTLVLDGRIPPGLPAAGLRVVAARRGGPNAADDRIVELIEPATLAVVTSDRDLRRRVEALGAGASGPAEFLRKLDAAADAD